MKEWKNERMKELKNERMKGWKDERMKGWKNERMKGWKDEKWKDEGMKGRKTERMKERNDEWIRRDESWTTYKWLDLVTRYCVGLSRFRFKINFTMQQNQEQLFSMDLAIMIKGNAQHYENKIFIAHCSK